MVESVDDRSATAQALSTASTVTAISLIMIVPAIIGYLVDQWLGTLFLFTVVGFALGMGSSIWQLIQFARYQDRKEERRKEELRRSESASNEASDNR